MTTEEISKMNKEKFIKAKREFENGDFFKIVYKKDTLIIGCFKSFNVCDFFYTLDFTFAYSYQSMTLMICSCFYVDFDNVDIVKASPQEVLFLSEILRRNNIKYNRKTKKIGSI